ncbi:DUF2325 domain-containing protein [Ramlibacter sp. RBP-2]|uniref:DUF2325 domain-containing protein n=1 Tax=Ramlibacter lithotrophicus TaxID=2606681 RepID=A0A7X6I551_9BURK|nr:DUF2325 domain-containing protein [Ramlibacter lithotrophicus]NKE64825.1 DUF2325 domain-containing protein [Ramlibacter lithotrophicus]
MCTSESTPPNILVRPGTGGLAPAARLPAPAAALPTTGAGSRRRRLWDLDGHAHCPVLGVCLPLPVLRKLARKVLGQQAPADDYELHCTAVAECKQRSALGAAVQRELDARYQQAVRQSALAKTDEALAAWWQQALERHDIAGPLWATLTHPRCTPQLAKQVEGDVHMLQHQVGMATRVDLLRFDALVKENAALVRELAAANQRSIRQEQEQTRLGQLQQAEMARLRTQLIGHESTAARLRHELSRLEAAARDLPARLALARERDELRQRQNELQQIVLQARSEANRQRRRAEEAEAMQQCIAPKPQRADADQLPALAERAILCVGGRPASVPAYRQLVERTGGRFLHHDGGVEDNASRLDTTLSAADLVICQTGCISHSAYWRVKDHCKRTGKRCIFVVNPSTAGLARALQAFAPAAEPGGDRPATTPVS